MAPRTIYANLPDGLQPFTLWDASLADMGSLGVIPCTATGMNAIVLTPVAVAFAPSPAYANNNHFSFVAVATSTGAVTVNINGLGAKNVYRSDGVTQIGVGEILLGGFYELAYGATLNSSAGGFYLAGATGGPVERSKLTANADFYVRRDGNDSNTGLANTAAGAWLTINKALTAISNGIDLAGFNVVVHVNGANVGDGTYTENLLVPGWVGYNGLGFGQFIVQGENGTATITGATATATILAAIGGNASPIQFKNFVLANANASGIVVEGDDGGFIALNTITFGSTGAGGILAVSTQVGGRLLFMAGTFTMKSGLSTGTGFYARSAGGILFQPGVTINFAGATTFSNAVADIATNGYFDDTGSTWTGTVPTGKPYVLDKNTGGLIVDVSLITGSLSPTIIPLSIGNGGTSSIVSTGSGAVVLAAAPTITGHPTIEGVTSTGSTGTGNLVYSASPTFTGTLAAATVTLSNQLTVSYASPNFTLLDTGTSFAYFQIQNAGGTNQIRIGAEQSAGGALFPGSAALSGVIGTTVNQPFQVFTNNTLRVTFNAAGGVTVAGNILSNTATDGIGYATGAGGSQTQITSRTTSVILNKVCGAITLFAAAPVVGTWVSFTVTNSAVVATDVPRVAVKSGTNTYVAEVSAVAAGSFQISFMSIAGTASDSPVINFDIGKAVVV